LKRTSIQSFDPRALEAAHRIDADVSLVLLVENQESMQKNLKRLTFTPDVYSPDYQRVNRDMIKAAHTLEIQVIPWTVNDEKSMRRLIEMGVDGLITDYPDLAIRVLADIQPNQ
jgi:glycerophosphoryl diester phosphodiesterase